uniref:Uncharacterized protein n=1 Tax=Rhizophora mucronata TaxID=61149 RepID=A0A2P2R222_RHIMU
MKVSPSLLLYEIHPLALD